MAQLGSYFGLCPLIDNKSLLGISEDQEKGSVIVTLGKNISIKYKLSDQKQIHSWRTKEKFTSPIIFDKNQSKYVAVFNQLYLRLWVGNEENLDKLKKFKFNQSILTIIPHSQHSYILFKNGAIYELSSILDSRKSVQIENILKDEEIIQDTLHITLNGELYVGLIITKNNEKTLLWTRVTNNKHKYCRIKLEKDGCKLAGYTFHQDKFNVFLLTMWSDGRMLSCKLLESDLDVKSPGELYTAIESILSNQLITMISLNENYIAMYGPNCNEEGALLIIYNTQFKVTQCKQSFKIFTSDSKLFCIEHNLFLPVGQNLAVVPFNLDTEQLASLIGSHKLDKVDADVSIVHELHIADWNTKEKVVNSVPEHLKVYIDDLARQGLPESTILENILPQILKNRDIKSLKLCLKHFYDIPEELLIDMLKFILNLDKSFFKETKKEKFHEGFPQVLLPYERSSVLDQILKKSFSDTLLLSNLRNLEFNDILKLLSYLSYLISNDGHKLQGLSNIMTDQKIIEWSCIVLDASYQKLILTSDDTLTEVLKKFKTDVYEYIDSLKSLQQVAPMLYEVKDGKSIFKPNNRHTMGYSIEQLSLY